MFDSFQTRQNVNGSTKPLIHSPVLDLKLYYYYYNHHCNTLPASKRPGLQSYSYCPSPTELHTFTSQDPAKSLAAVENFAMV